MNQPALKLPKKGSGKRLRELYEKNREKSKASDSLIKGLRQPGKNHPRLICVEKNKVFWYSLSMPSSKEFNDLPSPDSFSEGLLDQSILVYNLSLSIEDRLENHERALQTISELLKVRQQIYGEFSITS